MANRGSRGGNKGGRGEALRKLLQKAVESVRAEEEEDEDTIGPASYKSTVGAQGSSSQSSISMGRSAALTKLLQSAAGRGEGRSISSEASSYGPKRESLPTRSQPRPLMQIEPFSYGGHARESMITRGGMRSLPESHLSSGSKQEIHQPANRGVKFASSERETSPPGFPYKTKNVPPSTFEEEDLEDPLSKMGITDEYKPPVNKKGSYGTEVMMTANYIRLRVEEGKGVFQYDVKFNPEVDSLNVRYKLLREVTDIIGETKSFDGSILYLPFKLREKVFTAQLKLPTDGSLVTIKITFVKQLRMGDHTTVHLYNVLFRRIMNVLGLVLHGRHFFDPTSAMPLTAHKLEIWPGYITAIQEYEDGVMLCCDSSHRILRTQTVYELMQDLMYLDSKNWKDEFLKLIIGQTVLTRYNNRIYRVDDVSFDESPSDTFEKKDGVKVTYSDYYYHHYNVNIKDIRQPLLKSRVKGKIKGKEISDLVNLIPELCYMSGLTESIRADMRVMKDIAQCTRIPPNQRQYALNEFIKNVNSNKEVHKMLSSWGLSLASNNIKLTGRVIPPEDVYFGEDAVHRGNFNADWTKTATSNKTLSAIDFNNWALIATSRDMKVVEVFIDMLRKCTPIFGIRFKQPQLYPLSNDSTQAYIKALHTTKGSNFQIVVIIFPISRTDKYNAVKKWCCVDNPIPSQVILTKTIRKPDKLRSVTMKIALQMNCKLGGALWAVNIPVKNAMIIGLDTFHDSDRQCNSVGAVVASLNKQLTRWYSKVFTQAPGIELNDGLEISILACIQKYKEVNGMYPDQILIYRDGVSDGQMRMVEEFELPQIITACRRISPNYDPKFLFVVVQKRVTTRLFTEERKQYSNPSPGTVMDHTITRREYWDFFLVSQSIRQGTVTPTHYVVLHNSTRMDPDQVQRFTYKLTHLYYNWYGTIRVPAPCQYAHKLAYLVGENLHREAAESLADKLFFL